MTRRTSIGTSKGGTVTRAAAPGMVLLLVLAVITIGALVATTALYFASAQRASASASARRTQARALAWSGVQAATAELWSQRDALLRGAAPKLNAERTVYEDRSTTVATGDRGVYGLRAFDDRPMLAEAGRLDINSVPTDVLVSAGVGAENAAAIAGARRARPFASLAELMALPTWSTQGGEESRKAAGVLTVFSFDPQVQSSASPGSVHSPRIDVAGTWNAEKHAGLEAALGAELAQRVKIIVGAAAPVQGDKPGTAAKPPASLAEFYQRLMAAGLDIKAIELVVDVCTVGDQPFRTGLVSVLEAPTAVLAAIPGLSPDAARKIATARSGLADSDRASLAWLLERGVLTQQEYLAARPFLTFRCLQWRIIVTGGVITAAMAEAEATSGEAAQPRDRVVLEAVVDVSGDQPRIAYLRDITMAEAAEWLDARIAVLRDSPRPDADRASAAAPTSSPSVDAAPAPVATGVPNVNVAQPVRRGPASGGRVGRWTTGGGS